MERDGRIHRKVLILVAVSVMCLCNQGCTDEPQHMLCRESKPSGDEAVVTIRMTDGDAMTKVDKEMISDLSLIVFDEDGYAERNLKVEDGMTEIELNLIKGRIYSFFVCMNFGYHVFADHISEMDELTYHISGPITEMEGIPLSGYVTGITVSENQEIHIVMERLYAGISIILDRSGLNSDVNLTVSGIRICNYPDQTAVFKENRPSGKEEFLPENKALITDGTGILNRTGEDGTSGIFTLFSLENRRAEEGRHIEDEQSDTYLEIEMDYLSYTHFNGEGPLIYRTYLCDEHLSHDIERNCLYSISIRPEGSGLENEGWHVDKTWIREFGPSRFEAFPESYIQGEIGDTLHLWCEFYPPHAAFDIGLEELEHDKAEGIYDYIIDDDGKGVRLILKNPGVGIVYMEVGEPVNEAAMWVVVVNQNGGSPSSGTITATDISQYMNSHTISTAPEYRQRQDDHPHLLPPDQDRSPNPPHG